MIHKTVSSKVKHKGKAIPESVSPNSSPLLHEKPSWNLFAYSSILFVGLIAYANSLTGEFVFDDLATIVDNKYIRRLWPPWDPIFIWGAGTRPVMGLSLALNYYIGGLNTLNYHVFNLAIHLLNACVLFDLVRRVMGRVKFLANVAIFLSLTIALCWVAHPLNTESVTYITQRNESLMSLFLLLTIYAVERGNSSKYKSIYYGFAVLACALGMGTKQNMVATPLLVLLYDRTFLTGSFRNAFKSRLWLYIGLASTWLVLVTTFVIFPKVRSAGFKLKHVSAMEYALTQPQVIVHYLRLVLWPQDLCLDYYWPVVKGSQEILAYALIIIGLMVATAWALKSAPAIGFLGAWFFLILAPTSSVMPLNDLAAEHRMYLPSVSILVIIVLGAFALLRNLASSRKNSSRSYFLCEITMFIVVAGLTWRTILRNEDYKYAVSMWKKVVQQRPMNPRAPYVLGHYLYNEGKNEEARAWYEQALRIAPDYAEAHNNLGLTLDALGRQNEATSHFLEALRINPSLADAHNGLGKVHSQQGKFDVALQHYSRALQLDPDYAEAHNNLGAMFAQQGKFDLALEQYNRALQLKPEYAEARNNLGGLYLIQDKVESSLKEFSEAVRLKPDYRDAQNNLGLALLRQGKYEEAISHLTESIRLEPGVASTHYSLGRALLLVQRSDEAQAQFTEAVRLRPEYPEAYFYRAVALERENRISDAINSYQAALRIRPNWPDAMQKLAWILATGSDLDGNGQAEESLQLAQKALVLAKQPTAEYLDTVAVSYAATGRYKEAAQVARRAAAEALTSGRKDLSDEIQSRLQLYLAGRPYKQASQSIKK